MIFELLVIAIARVALVLLFCPFSALDKIWNFGAATRQARQAVASGPLARLLVAAGLLVELATSFGILTGIADRLAAFVLAGYCAVTALLFKRFWRHADFRLRGPSASREIFWDFLKNGALAGGLLLLACGPDARSVGRFFADPLSSTHPYAAAMPAAAGEAP